jgi:hypothetical protein
MTEQQAKTGPGDPLEPPDQLHECGDEPLLLLTRELELSPPTG